MHGDCRSAMNPAPAILSIATAVPPFRIDQTEVVKIGEALFPAFAAQDPERLAAIYRNAEIETRYSCVPLDWYRTATDFTERNALYVKNALDLLEQATERCLAAAGIGAEELGGIVLVSSTGVATPSLDALLMERMGLPRRLRRLPIFGLGCAGGVLGLARTAAMARAEPDKLWLLLVVELCGLTFRPNDASKSNLIATALFGDGAAALLIGCGKDGPVIRSWGEHTWHDTLDVMGWNVGSDGLGVVFSRDVPALVEERLGNILQSFLDDLGLAISDIDYFIPHPGGAKVLSALEHVFNLSGDGLRHARAVLRAYGNMSAATVLFILERALREGARGRLLLTSLGPGFTAAFLLLESLAGGSA